MCWTEHWTLLLLTITECQLWQTSSSAMAERPCDCGRLCCAMSTSDKFIVQLPAVVIRQATSAQNMFVYVAKSAFFEGEWVTFGKYLTRKGPSPTNHCWCEKARTTAVLCGIKISAVHHLILSEYTHLTDRQTDRIATHYMQPHGKNIHTDK